MRLGAVVFIAVAIAAAAIELKRPDDRQNDFAAQPRSIQKRDPLDTELARCSRLGEAGLRDPACLKAWAENRRRFLGQPDPSASVSSDQGGPARPEVR